MLRAELKKFQRLRENCGVFGQIFALIYPPKSRWSCKTLFPSLVGAVLCLLRGEVVEEETLTQRKSNMKI